MKWFFAALFSILLIYGLHPLYTEDLLISGGTVSFIAPEPVKVEEGFARTYILPAASLPAPYPEFEDESASSALPPDSLRGELRLRLSATEQGDIRVRVDYHDLRLDEQATLTPPRLVVRCKLMEDEWGEDIVEDVQGRNSQLISFTLRLDMDVEEIFFRRHELEIYWVLTLDLATRQLHIEHLDGSLSPPLMTCDD